MGGGGGGGGDDRNLTPWPNESKEWAEPAWPWDSESWKRGSNCSLMRHCPTKLGSRP